MGCNKIWWTQRTGYIISLLCVPEVSLTTASVRDMIYPGLSPFPVGTSPYTSFCFDPTCHRGPCVLCFFSEVCTSSLSSTQTLLAQSVLYMKSLYDISTLVHCPWLHGIIVLEKVPRVYYIICMREFTLS